MSIRSQWCEFDKETRKYIKKRDNNRCIFCGNNGALQIAHIFLSRSHGGKGCKENGVMLCIKCHQALDNGKDVSLRDQISQFCRAYLIKKEKFDKIKLNQARIAEEVGITRQYMNSIYNQATLCKKTTAYAITKSIDNNAEINDYFEMV